MNLHQHLSRAKTRIRHFLKIQLLRTAELVNAYREKQYQIVEGRVQVLHQQPATGHSKGDIVAVNGQQFEVNYFYATPAYRNTLAHHGVLSAGTYARIYCYNGEIVRIEIRK